MKNKLALLSTALIMASTPSTALASHGIKQREPMRKQKPKTRKIWYTVDSEEVSIMSK